MTIRTTNPSSVKENLLLLTLTLSAAIAAGQAPPVNEPDYRKPALFSDLPDTVKLTETDLLDLFNKKTGEAVMLKMTGSFRFAGNVTGNSSRGNPERTSLVVKSTNKPGAFLCLTKIADPAGTIIRGRIISRNHIDCYDLVYTPELGYQFLKKNYYKLISE